MCWSVTLLVCLATRGLAASPCNSISPPFAKRSQVPKSAFLHRNKSTCGRAAIPRAIGSTSAPVQWTQLRFYLHATGQAPILLDQTGPAFVAALNSANLGTVTITYTNAGTAVLSGVRLIAFVDLDIDRPSNGFANEYGAFVSLAVPPGAPAGAITANAWEIDEPGFLFGHILTNVIAGVLDNSNAVPSNAPDDVSFALQFPIGDLQPNQLFSAQLRLDSSNIGGLQQTDPDSNITVYLNGYAVRSTVQPPIIPPTPQIPVPSSLPLLLLSLAVTFAFRRQLFRIR